MGCPRNREDNGRASISIIFHDATIPLSRYRDYEARGFGSEELLQEALGWKAWPSARKKGRNMRRGANWRYGGNKKIFGQGHDRAFLYEFWSQEISDSREL